MINCEQADNLEKLTGQLQGIHSEIAALAKKSANDAVNAFKLKFINAVLKGCNELLRELYRPIGEFDQFDLDTVPSNSDVAFVAAQYLQALEKFRSDHIRQLHGYWCYDLGIPDDQIQMRTSPPAKLSK